MRAGMTIIIGALLFLTQAVQAAPIYYSATNDGGDQWTYNYEVANETGVTIDFFSIYFDNSLYEFNLVDLGFGNEIDPNDYDAPIDWFPETIVDDPFFPEEAQFVFGNGFFGATDSDHAVTGFSISFTWLGGPAGPGPQLFDYFDTDFNIFSDITQLRNDVIDVPEPTTGILLGAGLLLMLRRRKRDNSDHSARR